MLSVETCPFVSVIVPTYNRADMLAVTLESFFNQSYDKTKYEIIVVDNNSSDHTKQVIGELQSKSTVPLKYLFEPRQGVHYARNGVVKHTRGDILYYTDDDMIADVHLLKEIVKLFSYDDKVATVTGRVLPKWEQEPPRWVRTLCMNQLLSLQDRPEPLLISPYDTGVFSCHQALRRDAFLKSGGYNPENTGGEWIGDGESGLNRKLQELGYRFGYIGSSITYHMIPTERMTQRYLNKRLANQGNCDSYRDYRLYNYTRFDLARRILSHAKAITAEALKVLVKLSLKEESWRINRARINYFKNRIEYDFRLMTDRNWQKFVLKRDWLSEDWANPNNDHQYRSH
jgi:glycosyltransferase involved in cell wall biosynthesis